MEIIVENMGTEALVGDSVTSPQKAADPVVYQLVRVDGSGRLVPATDDEVMEVEDLLEGDKTEGMQQLVDIKTDVENPNVPPDPAVGSEKTDVQNEESIPSLVPTTGDDSLGQSGSPEGCSILSDRLDENESSSSAVDTSLKPDFSLLKGEICLDDLSVRDLQETFKATFGRETSVKDKQWLKRRLIMGLTNSCDFSTTTFIITDNRVVKKGKEESSSKSMDHGVLDDCVVKPVRENHEGTSTCHDKMNKTHSDANQMKIDIYTVQDISGSKDADTEQRSAKRTRKPTKRYIEELSEGESRDTDAKMVPSVRHHTHDPPSAVVCARPVHNNGLDGIYFTRKDSLGGSGVQVPYVSRIRRSRPRENFTTLMEIQPSGMGMSTRLIKKDTSSSEQLDTGSGNKVFKASSSPRWIKEPHVDLSERCTLYSERKEMHVEKDVELESMESYKNSSDDDVVTVRTANGGMRRKHHRPWTLTEVVKLVEGVAKYGVGRWSEIKRLAFASYSYRTSVDLKDKWRNLLRASVAELPAKNGMQSSRKQASVPIPAPILSRVRELSDIQTQSPQSLGSSKFGGYSDSGTSVHETRSGFL